MKQEINQLINHMLGDCIHSDNPTDLYNALVRLEKGSVALLNIARIHELESYLEDEV